MMSLIPASPISVSNLDKLTQKHLIEKLCNSSTFDKKSAPIQLNLKGDATNKHAQKLAMFNTV